MMINNKMFLFTARASFIRMNEFIAINKQKLMPILGKHKQFFAHIKMNIPYFYRVKKVKK